ncbi:hypothetical protein WR25_18347 [Diploscapter pachys]|uniref:Uncharacterized protein n=1 Tax=Diploscapter pachys TaxID=2018661 RepID=A0A2A2M1R1_9BILA|nr:hypothetical protein WR25_18347 [Diploscapter pachys]
MLPTRRASAAIAAAVAATPITAPSVRLNPAKDVRKRRTAGPANAAPATAKPTPSCPPATSPSDQASAIGLRNSACINVPATPSAPPATTAVRTRGRRIAQTISDRVGSPDPVIAPITSSGERMTWP